MKFRDGIDWLLLGAIWGAAFLFTRIAVPEFGPYALVEVRLAVAAIVLVVPVLMQKQWQHIRKHWRTLLLLGAINSAIPFTLFAYATVSLTAGDTSVLNATAPLFGAAIGGVFLREKLSSGRMLGLVIGFLGVVTLVWEKLSFSGHVGAVIAGLSGAAAYGIAIHIINCRLKGVPSMAISAGTLISASFMLLPVALMKLPAEVPSAKSWFAAVALGIFCSAIAFLMYFRLLSRIGPTRAMTVAYIIPAFGIMWGHLILSEAISLFTLVGGVIIVIGTMFVHFAKRAPTAPPTQD